MSTSPDSASRSTSAAGRPPPGGAARGGHRAGQRPEARGVVDHRAPAGDEVAVLAQEGREDVAAPGEAHRLVREHAQEPQVGARDHVGAVLGGLEQRHRGERFEDERGDPPRAQLGLVRHRLRGQLGGRQRAAVQGRQRHRQLDAERRADERLVGRPREVAGREGVDGR
ncbi:hypothetical protein [Actinomadura madurae]|uniref:hypothetical protein n=1 Tax=Actinomadura madurae TaxID=1993 RepID=UPI0020D21263|nr:hypothetical protein [Actinomadura madurae]MCQ0004927.1 hypothetical protein [Actinomadura madurae]